MKPRAEPEPFPLGPALDFLQRLWQLNHALARLSSRMEKDLGITAQQRLVIRCLGKFPGITASQLAVLLHIDPGTVSATLRRLELRRLIERRRDPKDSRRRALALTRKGHALDAPATGTVEDAVDELLRDRAPRETAATVAVLERFTELLDARVGGRS